MIGDALFLSLIFSLLAGGSIKALGQVEMRYVWLVITAVVIQYGGQWLSDRGVTWVIEFGQPIYLSSLAAVLVFVWLNRHLPGLLLAGIGVLCNALVIAANGGHMPVSPEALNSAGLAHVLAPLQSGTIFTHTVIDHATRLPWLGDIIPLSHPYPRPKVVSIGDLILAVGVVTCVVCAMRPWPFGREQKTVAPRQ